MTTTLGTPSRPARRVFGPYQVDVVVPDSECAALLLWYALPVFPADLVTDAPLRVRLHPPRNETRWVIELPTLVGRWLESAPLPCATVVYEGRTYLIRTSMDVTHFAVADSGSDETERNVQ
jgi:hypothetical protein